MSLIVVERAGGGELSRENSGKIQAQRQFLVYSDDGSFVSLEDASLAAGLPIIGQPHPDSPAIIVGSFSISIIEDRPNAFDITYNYAPPEVVDGDGDPSDPIGGGGGDDDSGTIDGSDPDSGVTAFTIRVGLSVVDIWKTDPDLPDNLDEPAREDIGGILVSEGGYPISYALPIADIAINQQIAGFMNIGSFLGKIGKRNAGTWNGFDSGSLLFTGVDISQDIFGVNDIQYQLAWDEFYHLRQAPERDEDGNPTLDLTEDPPTMNVFFKQPFPNTISFNFLPVS